MARDLKVGDKKMRPTKSNKFSGLTNLYLKSSNLSEPITSEIGLLTGLKEFSITTFFGGGYFRIILRFIVYLSMLE